MGVDELTRTKRVSLTFLCLEKGIESDIKLVRIGSSSELSHGKRTSGWDWHIHMGNITRYTYRLAWPVMLSRPGGVLIEPQRLVVVWLRVEEFCSKKQMFGIVDLIVALFGLSR